MAFRPDDYERSVFHSPVREDLAKWRNIVAEVSPCEEIEEDNDCDVNVVWYVFRATLSAADWHNLAPAWKKWEERIIFTGK